MSLAELGEEPKSHGVSMFHQLHCVGMLRDALIGGGGGGGEHHHSGRAKTSRRGLEVPEHEFLESEASAMSPEEHLEHCLDYITQVSASQVQRHMAQKSRESTNLLILSGDHVCG